jgi:hypothetical protein
MCRINRDWKARVAARESWGNVEILSWGESLQVSTPSLTGGHQLSSPAVWKPKDWSIPEILILDNVWLVSTQRFETRVFP